ncbi:MAG: hypothetical protein ACPLYF_01275 [Fervidobacterium sp.]
MNKILFSVIVASAALVVSGIIIMLFFSAPFSKSAVTRNESLVVRAQEYKTKDFSYYSAWDNIVSFNVLNGTIESCEPLTEALYLEWQAGQYVPNWTQTDHGEYYYKGTYIQPPMMSPVYGRYFLFFNQDSYDKVIQWQITSRWEEPNVGNLTIGATSIIIGLGIEFALILIHTLKHSSYLLSPRQP